MFNKGDYESNKQKGIKEKRKEMITLECHNFQEQTVLINKQINSPRKICFIDRDSFQIRADGPPHTHNPHHEELSGGFGKAGNSTGLKELERNLKEF